MSLRLYTRLGRYIIETTELDDGFRTQILVVVSEGGWENQDGAGQPLLDVDQEWERTTLSETSARLMHDEAVQRAMDERFDDATRCSSCSTSIDPLDEDARDDRCGRCVSEATALERAAS